MNSKTIIASLGLMGLACTAQAASSDPWEYYRMGGDYRSAYTTRYDSTFGMSIRGMYSFCSDDLLGLDMPDLGGAQLGLHTNIQTTSVFHELSLNIGLLYGSKTYYTDDQGHGFKYEQLLVPMTFGYTLNIPMSDIATFYLGGKAGVLYYEEKASNTGGSIFGSDSGFTCSAQIGFKFAIGEKTDFMIGYEMNKYFSNVDAYHTITAGFSWSF
ncbi:hypothetical protein CXU17_09305 [Akkermansia muciniphila]|nr:hypothetical protein CXU17_09305 [Akkermansia muciniphila]